MTVMGVSEEGWLRLLSSKPSDISSFARSKLPHLWFGIILILPKSKLQRELEEIAEEFQRKVSLV